MEHYIKDIGGLNNMNIKTGNLMLVTILVVLSLTVLMSAASAQTVKIANGNAQSGATTTVTITADNITDLANFDINLTYDPSVVNVTAADNNVLFGTSVNNLEGASTGFVRLASLSTAAGQTGSSVILSTLTLKAVGTATQTSAMTLTINLLLNSSEGDIHAAVNNGVFTVNAAGVPVLTTITVSPKTATVIKGKTTTFNAIALDQFNSPIDATVTWTSGNYLTVGTINASTGVFTANATGTTTITATNGSVSGNATATVIAASIVDTYLPPGATQAQRKVGVTNAVNDYLFNHILSKTDITAIVNAYLFPS